MALGAKSSDVLRSVVGRAVGLAGVGVIAGVIAALMLGGIIRNQLFGVNVFDPTTLATVIGVLLLSAAIASLLPATRAARIDPIRAFRES
jgi:ABC-type antimicrobial peptide transport system permease subunit